MERSKSRTRPRPLLAALAAFLIALSNRSGAQVGIGTTLPPLKAVSTAKELIAINASSGRLEVKGIAGFEQPKALFVHFFQPDCLQCQAELAELAALDQALAESGVLVLALAYRGSEEAVHALTKERGGKPPLAILSTSPENAKLGAGDSSYVVDSEGKIRFHQAGFGKGDQKIWREVLGAVLAGRPSPHESVDRRRLQAGDRFPAVALPSLRSGKGMSLLGDGDRLLFTDDTGKTTRPKAALFFFSRY